MTNTRKRRVAPSPLLIVALILTACERSGTGPDPHGIDLDALFRTPTPAEIAAVEAEWAMRNPAAQGVLEEASATVLFAGGLGSARVFSHVVDGYRHYGATLAPLGAQQRSLPVVVYAHGGDTGVGVSEVALTLLFLGERARNFVYVIPSFRSERLTLGASVFTSEGEPSPWDRDVDDALALLNVALERVPEADPTRIGALGISRGGTVALLMAIRDPRIELVSELAGPTDFTGTWVRGLTEDALRGEMRPLPGAAVLNERFIQPLMIGAMSSADFRRELLRRSPVVWADRLPPVQVNHGMADDIVPVGQAETLIAALLRLPRGSMQDEFYLYPDAGHNMLEMRNVDTRIVSFLHRLRQ